MFRNNTIERLLTEIRILAMLKGSAHVVNLLDFFEDETFVYLVLEYVEGVDFASIVSSFKIVG